MGDSNKNTQALIGLGLDNQYRGDYPGGMRELCDIFRDKLSHISIVSLPSIQEAKEFKKIISKDLPVIHHLSGIAPCDPEGPNYKRLELQSNISKILEARWCLEDIGIWSIGPYNIPYFAPPPFLPNVANLVAKRITEIQNKINIPFLAEVPSCSYALGTQTLGDFFNQIVSTSGCRMVLDVSHVFSYALATNRNPIEVLKSLPLDAAWEIHIAGGKISHESSKRYIDTHSDPIVDGVLEVLVEAIKLCKNLKAITYEIGVKSSSKLISEQLENLRSIINKTNFQPVIN